MSAAYCSRLIFLKSTQFRTQPGFHWLKKTNAALLRFKSVDIVSAIENFQSFLPEASGKSIELPNLQNFEYLLVKFQTISKMFVRIAICAKMSCQHFLKLLNLGFFVELNTTFISLLGQVWTLSKDMCKKTVEIFNKLQDFMKCFKSGKRWLPEDYIFPTNLSDFLEDDWKEEILPDFKDSKNLLSKTKKNIFNLVSFEEDTEVEFKNVKILNSEKLEEEISALELKGEKSVKKVNISKICQTDYEIGEPIDRNSLLGGNNSLKRKMDKKNKNKMHNR